MVVYCYTRQKNSDISDFLAIDLPDIYISTNIVEACTVQICKTIHGFLRADYQPSLTCKQLTILIAFLIKFTT